MKEAKIYVQDNNKQWHFVVKFPAWDYKEAVEGFCQGCFKFVKHGEYDDGVFFARASLGDGKWSRQVSKYKVVF